MSHKDKVRTQYMFSMECFQQIQFFSLKKKGFKLAIKSYYSERSEAAP